MRFQAEVTADVRAQDPYTVEDHQASLAEHLLCGIAKQGLGCVIPKANLARLTDSEDPVRGVFEKSKQFRFKHILRALRNQHERVKEKLPLLQGTAATVADRYRTRYPELPAIDELIQALSLKLTAHLTEEEDTLFPALLQLELAYLGESPIAGYPKRVRKILTSMSLQHDTSGLMLHQIWAESHGLNPPEDADSQCREFYGDLRKFFGELHRDFHMENNILFPQAAQMEAEIFRGSPFSRC